MSRALLYRFSAALVLALVISSFISYYFLGHQLLENQIENMTHTIRVVDYSLGYSVNEKTIHNPDLSVRAGAQMGAGGNLQAEITELHQTALRNDTRITIIGLDGEIYADTDIGQVPAMENHLDREEVKEALSGGKGHAERYSETFRKKMLYVASLSDRGDYIIRLAIPYTGILDYLVVILPMLLIGIFIAFVIAFFIAVRFTGTITKPLTEIAEEMQQVRSSDLNFTFKNYQYEELNIISNITIKLTEEIRAHLNQLAFEKKVRQEFFSNASHELKTPITSVHGYAELLEQELVQDEDTKKDFYARILRETRNMAGLINDILMISMLETKETEVNAAPVRVAPLLAEIFESLEPIAAKYEVTLHSECEPAVIEASEKQLRELIINLVSNGIKYNHPGGNVWVTIGMQKDQLVIYVKDDGMGISQADQERVFERFYRVDKGRSKTMGGTGLGLSIVKHIVEYYDGTIELTSEKDCGSTFRIAFSSKLM